MLAQNEHGFKKPLRVKFDMLHTSSGYMGSEDRGRRICSVLGRGGHYCLGTDRVLRSTLCI